MQLSHKSTKICISGASGTGKSTFWTRLVLGYKAQTKFVFDHELELCERLKIRPARNVPELAIALSDPPNGEHWVIYDPEAMFGSDLEKAFGFFCDFCFTASIRIRGTKLFGCDELQAVTDCHTIPKAWQDILQRGRRRGIDTAIATQAPNEIHNKLRNQLTEVVAFAAADERALEWLEKYGFNGEELRQLPAGEFIARRRGALNQTRGKVF